MTTALGGLTVVGAGTFGQTTVAFGTVINQLVPTKRGARTRLTMLQYRAAGTAHTITVFRSIGRTRTTADAAASQAVVVVAANPGPSGNALAASDFVAIRLNDGTFVVDTVSSISGLSVTLATNLAAALSKGADVWMFGITSDTDPNSGEAHQAFVGTASVITTIKDDTAGLVASHGLDEPLLVQSNNATATGFLEQVGYVHTRR